MVHIMIFENIIHNIFKQRVNQDQIDFNLRPFLFTQAQTAFIPRDCSEFLPDGGSGFGFIYVDYDASGTDMTFTGANFITNHGLGGNCGQLSCQYGSSCGSPYDGAYSSPISSIINNDQISFKQNIKEGYYTYSRYCCTSDLNITLTFTYTLYIQQNVDCTINQSNKLLEYDKCYSATEKYEIPLSLPKMFVSHRIEKCDIQGCTYGDTCETASKPFPISLNLDVKLGEITNLCMKCTSPLLYPGISYNSAIQFTQHQDCSESMTVGTGIDPDEFEYDSTLLSRNIDNYKDVFVFKTTDDKDYCPVYKCVLMEEGCLIPLVTTNILVSRPYELQIKASTINPEGYTETFCVVCYTKCNAPFQKDSITIKATALDCSNSLVKKQFLNPPPIAYQTGGSNVPIIQTYQDMFIHTQKVDCVLEQCLLMVGDCKTGLISPNLIFNVTSVLDIQAISTNPEGYDLSFCLKCDIKPTGLPVISFYTSSFQILATALDCSQSLKLPDSPFQNPPPIAYLTGGTPISIISTYEEMFKHTQKPDDCKIDKCLLMDKDCLSELISPNIIFNVTGSFDIEAISTNPEGYDLSFCLQCDIKPIGLPIITFNTNSFQILATALDCSNSLVKKQFLNLPPIAYLTGGTPISIIQTYEDMFIHTQKVDCVLNLDKCLLMDRDCKSELISPNLFFNLNSNFNIQAIQTNPEGYREIFCLKCDIKPIGLPIITFITNTFQISATALDCSNSLAELPFKIPLPIAYKTLGPNILIIKTYEEIFIHSEKMDCALDQCLLLAEDCESEFVSTNVILNGNGNFNIEAIATNTTGYSEKICFQCFIKPIGLPLIKFSKIDLMNIVAIHIDCLPGLIPKIQTKFIIDYDQVNMQKEFNMNDLFTQKFIIDCNWTCDLKDSTCENKITGSNILYSNPLVSSFAAKSSIKKGYQEDICIKCTDSFKDEKLKKISITQKELDCSSAISYIYPPRLTSQYVKNGKAIKFMWTDFFKDHKVKDCNVQCSLRDNCNENQLTGKEVSIQSYSNLTFSWETNLREGFTKSLCIRCSTPDLLNFDKYVGLQQTPDCQILLKNKPFTSKQFSFKQNGRGNLIKFNEIYELNDKILKYCPLQCSIGLTCDTYLQGSILQQQKGYYLEINVPNDQENGFIENVCARCESGIFKFEKKFTIIQHKSNQIIEKFVSFQEKIKQSSTLNITTPIYEITQQTLQNNYISVEFGIESMEQTGQITIRFSHSIDNLKEEKFEQKVINGEIEFEVIQNQELLYDLDSEGMKSYQVLRNRNTTISSSKIIDIQQYSLTAQLYFHKPQDISVGGMKQPDHIVMKIIDRKFLEFKQIFAKNNETGKIVKMFPLVINQTISDKYDISKQLDSKNNINLQALDLADKLCISMISILVGKMVTNIFVSASMKSILSSIRVLQIASFFIFFQIDYTPIARLYLQTINDFVVFKIVPEKLMKIILEWFGIGSNVETDKINQDIQKRQLIETNFAQKKGYLENLNMIFIGVIIFIFAICIYLISKGISILLTQQRVSKIHGASQKLGNFLVNLSHSTIDSGAIPIQIETMKKLGELQNSNSPFFEQLVPITILFCFVAYPITTYLYLTANISRLDDNLKDNDFQEMHKSAFKQIRYYRKRGMGLGFIMLCHYRRFVYSLIIYTLPNYFAIQIGLIMMISIIMMIIIIDQKPFQILKSTYLEAVNELMIILVLYHVIIASEFVPIYEIGVQSSNGYSIIAIISASVIIFIYLNIHESLIKPVYKKIKEFSHQRELKRIQKKNIPLVENIKNQIQQIDKQILFNKTQLKGNTFKPFFWSKIKILEIKKEKLQKQIEIASSGLIEMNADINIFTNICYQQQNFFALNQSDMNIKGQNLLLDMVAADQIKPQISEREETSNSLLYTLSAIQEEDEETLEDEFTFRSQELSSSLSIQNSQIDDKIEQAEQRDDSASDLVFHSLTKQQLLNGNDVITIKPKQQVKKQNNFIVNKRFEKSTIKISENQIEKLKKELNQFSNQRKLNKYIDKWA